MKRKLFIGMLLLAVLLCFASCKEEKTKDDIKNQQSEKEDDTPGGNQGQEKEPTSPEETGVPDDPPADPSLKTITGITFTDFSTVFDDMPHRLEITGTLPDGVTVRYTGNEATEPGVYAATATLSGEGYNTLVLRASLTIRKKTITGVTFPDSTVVYDGTSHAVTVKGNLPQGVSVSYNQNQAKNAGTYRAVATLSGRGYETLTLSATLTIEKANITGITLADDTVLYDGKAHSIQVVGNVPAGVTCTYQYNSETLSGVAGAGDYTVVATLSGSNHKTLTLTATLKIISFSEDELTCQYYKGKVYFQNPLDKDRLYAYTVSGGKLEKVNNDKPAFFTEAGGKLYYTSKGLLSSTMKEISSAGISEVAAFSGEYLVSDGTYLYFALNPLIDLKDTAGIYRYKLGENEDPERLYAGKAGWLTLYQNYIYFTDGANKGVLRRISKNGGTASLVYDETVSDVTLNGSYLYFNQYSLLGNAIYRYSLSGGKASKITVDSGKNLTVIGNYLYYINHDLLTGKVFGDGIYRVSLTGTLGLPGSKVVEGKVCSLQSDGDTLFYYTVAAKHLFAYSVSTQTATDLMQSFTPIENDIISGYEESKVYKGEIYFINPKDKDALYKYNPQTFASFKVIATACSDFYFDDGYIYYSSYILTNYALFRVKEDGSAPAEKISRDRCDSLVFDGDDIYYINNGVTSNAVYRMKKDGLIRE
ncbi:MAG: DUF5050 domain-containing protein [Clostridia bacterium]|nr:DUF5050 domain-containing protein [Clostridia bacterium]